MCNCAEPHFPRPIQLYELLAEHDHKMTSSDMYLCVDEGLIRRRAGDFVWPHSFAMRGDRVSWSQKPKGSKEWHKGLAENKPGLAAPRPRETPPKLESGRRKNLPEN
ncbi:unnamed protein product [Bursaphelenchus okinawaensis]|uniref:Uncharacterized protein n=1 Tax=Bursaphelenchus okinawaensis TaxID=465554 RepID=A0A811LMD1_9BILA|nr:unnamed protein product [Bursaphelenchus okinawaensis]CAG9126136.1 unnamed protein product [Bursaphelenchus okinawaensis]